MKLSFSLKSPPFWNDYCLLGCQTVSTYYEGQWNEKVLGFSNDYFSHLGTFQPPYVKNPNEASDAVLAICWLGDTKMLGILYRSGFRPCPLQNIHSKIAPSRGHLLVEKRTILAIWLRSYFFRNKTFLFFKRESWNFQCLFVLEFRETSQNLSSFILYRQLLFWFFLWVLWGIEFCGSLFLSLSSRHEKVMKSDNLQYNMLARWLAWTNNSTTKHLMFQVLFFLNFLQNSLQK